MNNYILPHGLARSKQITLCLSSELISSYAGGHCYIVHLTIFFLKKINCSAAEVDMHTHIAINTITPDNLWALKIPPLTECLRSSFLHELTDYKVEQPWL